MMEFLDLDEEKICYLCGSMNNVSRQKVELEDEEKDFLDGSIDICKQCMEDTDYAT